MIDRVRNANPLDEVRSACAIVVAEATHVRIDAARVSDYAAALPLDTLGAATFDPQYHFQGEAAETVAFILTLDTINFGSGYFPHLRKRPGLSGYFTIASALTEHFHAHGSFSALALCTITTADCRTLFGQVPDGGLVDELMGHFAEALNELGRYLLEHFSGEPAALVASAEQSAARLVALLSALPAFRDVAIYRGILVPFYKRAQLVVADLALALGGKGLGAFADLDRLTIFADNLVPHVLHVDGVLQYDTALEARIAAGELLPAGAAEEIEIRAAAVHAVELLVAACRAQDRQVTARELDYLLWHRGLAPRYRALPRHRTRTIYY